MKNAILYSANEKPPLWLLVFSSLQHMLLVLSLGLAVPVTVARAAGLTSSENALFLSIALFCIGLTSIIQTMPFAHLGTGYQSLSVSDSAAISASTMAVQLGGMPLLYGMTIFSGLLKSGLASFTYRFRKLFPPEVTGCMIFILGINIIPTGMKYFLGTANNAGVYDYTHIIVASISFMIMLVCTLFLKKLKPYGVLIGIIVGFIISALTGLFDTQSFNQLSQTPLIGLPIIKKFELAFDWKLVIPFIIVTISSVVDNIGDYTATQRANDSDFKNPKWKSVENGLRASGIGTILSGLLGGVIQATATANIGVATATGVTSRRVAYVAGAMLIALSFFPRLTGLIMLIPSPVLGATLLYSIAYIMAGGFTTLSSIEIDDRRIFVIFVSITFSISTLIPGLWSFLPQNVSDSLVSPMVMGTIVLLFMSLIVRIGRKKIISFSSGLNANDIQNINKKVVYICKDWGATREVCSRLQIGVDAICESLFTMGVTSDADIKISYDQLQVQFIMVCNDKILKSFTDETYPEIMVISLNMIKNMFDNVKVNCKDGIMKLEIDADI